MGLLNKYWRHHKRRAFSIVFALILSMAALVCSAFLARSAAVNDLKRAYNYNANFDLFAPYIADNDLHQIIDEQAFSQTGMLHRGGYCKTNVSEEFIYGALADKNAEEIYHLTPIKGRYPQNSGEITAMKKAFAAFGVYAQLGESISVDLYDFERQYIETFELTIVGILDDELDRTDFLQSSIEYAQNVRRTRIGQYPLPAVFLYTDDILHADSAFMGIYDTRTDVSAYEKRLAENNIPYIEGNRIDIMLNYAMMDIEQIDEASLLEALPNANKDFNALVLIPTFTLLVLIVTFLSTYDVVTTAMNERSRQFGLLRCMGMRRQSVFFLLSKEAVFFVFISLIIGFAIGVIVYLIIIFVQINVFGINTNLAFHVIPVVDAVSINPYSYPFIVAFACALIAVLIPAINHTFNSPLEIFTGNHNNSIRVNRRRFRSAEKLLSKKLHSKLGQNITTTAIAAVVMSACFFGFLYFSAQTSHQNASYQSELDNANLNGLDYLAERDFEKASCGTAQINLYDAGIPPQEISKLKESHLAAKIRYVIEAKSTKAVYLNSDENKEIMSSLQGCNLKSRLDELQDLFKKSLLQQGYLENERLFNIPTAAVSPDALRELSEYLAEGTIDYDLLYAGKEVLILESENGVSSPYQIGDMITMTDAVIDDELIQKYDFSSGHVPEGYEPHFLYVYTNPDGTPEINEIGEPMQMPGYSFGQRVDFNVRVAGRLIITDEALAQFYISKPLQGNCGFNLLCLESAFSIWGLPYANYTKAGAVLESANHIEEFDKLWFHVIGNSRDMSTISTTDIRTKMRDTAYTNMNTFLAMIVLLVALGLVGIINTINLRIRKQAQTFSMLRAIGMPNKKVNRLVIRQNIKYPIIGALLCWIPLGAYQAVFKYIDYLKDIGEYEYMITVSADGRVHKPWYWTFPKYDLLEQPVLLAFMVTVAMMLLVMVIASLLPMRWLNKQSIVGGIRRDDF